MATNSSINPISERMEKFQTRTLVQRTPVATVETILQQPSTRPVSRPIPSQIRYTVPELTSLSLDTLAHHFEVKPSLNGIPPQYAAAIAQRLPVDLDVRLTMQTVHDEHYWRRVCEHYKSILGEISLAEHGCSWKQAFAELYISYQLETFGHYPDIPLGYDDEFCRSAIDSSHPNWITYYPAVAKTRLDNQKNRERFAASSSPDVDIDSRIISSGDCGWPYLERLKTLCKNNAAAYENNYAWYDVDRKAHIDKVTAEEKTYQETKEKEANGIVEPPPAPGGTDEAAPTGPAIPLPPSLLAVPFSVAAERNAKNALMSQQRTDDLFDCTIEGAALREYITPNDLAEWKRTTAWPKQRYDSILTTRAKELQTLLDRISSCVDYIFRLKIKELPSHLDLELITSRLPNLTALEIMYAPRHVGIRFDPTTALMTIPDAGSLTRCLRTTDVLTSLCLSNNHINDSLLALLMQGLLNNKTITHLDLSHNNIQDTGAGLIAKMLSSGTHGIVLTSLKLGDNRITKLGANAIGNSLRYCRAINNLDLQLNLFQDDGCVAILNGILHHPTLETLNISSNNAGSITVKTLTKVLSSLRCAIKIMDISGNEFSDNEAKLLINTISNNKRIIVFDIRNGANINPSTLETLQNILHTNELLVINAKSIWPLQGTYNEAFLHSLPPK